MNTKPAALPQSKNSNVDLSVAFDVGHSSIGWAVLQTGKSETPDLLGCGAVIFPADDCLASQRRGFRRQRRHIRATRQRIERMKMLLAHFGVLSREQLDQPGCAWPWLLAARVLRGGKLLSWPELWDVLRWYAHNRGYDGNERWSTGRERRKWEDLLDGAMRPVDVDAAFRDLDIDPVEGEPPKFAEDEPDEAKLDRARAAMEGDVPCASVAETVCKFVFEAHTAEALAAAIFGTKVSAATPPDRRFKSQRLAFPRRLVECELLRIMLLQRAQLSRCDDTVIRLLLASDLTEEDRRFLCGVGIHLPKRYDGGLLFGQLVPRFDNRILAQCRITYARKLPMLLRVTEGREAVGSDAVWSDRDREQIEREMAHFRKKLMSAQSRHQELARSYAADIAKVPVKRSLAFLDYRWAMLLANIKIRKPGEIYPGQQTMRPLTAGERSDIDTRARAKGFLKYQRKDPKKAHEEINELADIVHDVTGCAIDDTNLDGFFIPPDMREALKLVPIASGEKAFRHVWQHLDEALRRRFTIQLLRRENSTGLKASDVCHQLRTMGRADLADAIEASASAKLLETPFHAQKLEGRSPYHHDVLRQVQHEVMRGEDPRKKVQDEIFLRLPKARHGCLVVTEEMQRYLDERPLASQTNNHLVRHRILILTGHRRAKPKQKNGLLDDLVAEFANGDLTKIKRVTIEVARELQEMSGKSNEEKKDIERSKRAEHRRTAEKLAAIFGDERSDGKPIEITAGLIKKARIGDDLGWDEASRSWRCPYTGQMLDPRWLCLAKSERCRIEKDHIIPQSQRLSNAIEAQVLTFAKVNAWKDNRTAFQFIREFGGQPVPGLTGVNLLTLEKFREFVHSLPTKGLSKRDVMRKKKRKELLLTETWTDDEFTPGDLTKTSHIVTVAAENLRARFRELPHAKRPDIVHIPGSITHVFRDKQWRLFRELAAVHSGVRNEMEKGADRVVLRYSGAKPTERADNKKRLQALGKNVKKALAAYDGVLLTPTEMSAADAALREVLAAAGEPRLIDSVCWGKTTLNLKQAIRGITHLHHALDATAIGLVSEMLVPARATGIHDTVARAIIKERLNAGERREFESIRHQLGLPQFYRWASTRCDNPSQVHPTSGEGGRLCLTDLLEKTRNQIIAALEYAREHRVIQHIPARMSGMPVDQHMWHLKGWASDGRAILEKHSRGASGARRKDKPKPGAENKQRLIGWEPKNRDGKLKRLEAVLITNGNYGVALTDPEPTIIPFHKVAVRLRALREANGGRSPGILRNGMLIAVPNGTYAGVWRIFSIKNTKRDGLVLDIGRPDEIYPSKVGAGLKNLRKNGMSRLRTTLVGPRA